MKMQTISFIIFIFLNHFFLLPHKFLYVFPSSSFKVSSSSNSSVGRERRQVPLGFFGRAGPYDMISDSQLQVKARCVTSGFSRSVVFFFGGFSLVKMTKTKKLKRSFYWGN